MKYIKIVLKILLLLSLIVLSMSFVIKHIVIDTFSQEILSKKVSGYYILCCCNNFICKIFSTKIISVIWYNFFR